MKRLTLSVVMTGVLGLAAFSLSNAQQSGDSPRGRGPAGRADRADSAGEAWRCSAAST